MGYANMKFEHSTTVPLIDEFIYAGKVWRIGATFTGLTAAATGYVVFKTPANAITLYQISEVGKTGGECFVTLKEGFTLTGTPTAITTPYNANRNYKDSVCKLTQLGYGTSATLTLTGGVDAPPTYLSGENQGNQKAPGSAGAGDYIPLLPNTLYALAVTNASTSTANINVLFKMAVDV